MIIPSIDLMNGKAVQLKQGKDKMLEREDPIDLAREFNKFNEIAVIDLDAAMGRGSNAEIIRQICGVADCRVGGGIKDIQRAKELISWGASKIIIGSKAFENDQINHEFLKALTSGVGKQRIIIAVDAFEGEIVTQAWQHRTGLMLFDVVKELETYASEFLFTCVEKEGGLQGTDLEIIQKLRQATDLQLTVAGGVTSLDEIRKLAALGVDVQLGMAIYTAKIRLDDGFIESLNWKSDLIPTITCDDEGQVLMLAYSSKESLKKTFETGKAWYFSRSRNRLWQKGETSGNVQELIKIRTDCDGDALLVTVRQKGVACHLGRYSCFGDKKFSLQELYQVIKDRFDYPTPGSYTATLTDKKVREKLLEEAEEVVIAKTRDEIIWEAADVLYFLTTLLVKSGVEIGDVLNELRRRRRQ
ncbi:MAG: bifunctional phosphoribosyl-AMP cyclohydrolase/phosphoribosyl-ATP diphosphatase HisIE [candidate division KSB1 bacterium]|nr:bifunctional phosphoribosyl-AMP cyclohydrolase/phosphoribosyl-ATP diphosphatase HisIE [candidate division KSB1 bacterium]